MCGAGNGSARPPRPPPRRGPRGRPGPDPPGKGAGATRWRGLAWCRAARPAGRASPAPGSALPRPRRLGGTRCGRAGGGRGRGRLRSGRGARLAARRARGEQALTGPVTHAGAVRDPRRRRGSILGTCGGRASPLPAPRVGPPRRAGRPAVGAGREALAFGSRPGRIVRVYWQVTSSGSPGAGGRGHLFAPPLRCFCCQNAGTLQRSLS